MLLWRAAFVFILCISSSYSTKLISLYADLYENKDFFKTTFPWIIDNIGGEISVDFYMLGSGRYAIPQMCALKELKMNTYLQAQYLKCEAEGKGSKYCLCETGIDPAKFKECVTTGGYLTSLVSSKYTQMGFYCTLIVDLGKETVCGLEDEEYLKSICTIFGESLPRGCIEPFPCDECERYNALAQFDKKCDDLMPTDPPHWWWLEEFNKSNENKGERGERE